MKGVVIVAAAAAVLAVGSEALTLRERSNNNAPRVVHLPFEKKTVSRPASQSRRRRLMAKRSGTISSTLTNFEVRLLLIQSDDPLAIGSFADQLL